MKKFLKNFLKKIEEQNTKSLGGGKLDCCDLNKSENKKINSNNNK